MNTLAELLSSRGRAEIFRLLFGPVNQELHVRELARQSGLADATVRQELKKLTRIGVVEGRQDGNRTYYRANLQHPLSEDIRSLVLKTSGLGEVLREALGDSDICLAFVFGSVGSAKEKAHSDVDLMVIGGVTLRQLGKRLSGITTKIGREVNPHVLTIEEFTRRVKEGDHFITSVLATPRLFVKGSEDELTGLGK